jgi:membrane-associated protein
MPCSAYGDLKENRMTHAEQFLLSHPLTVLAGFILGEQTGLPIASAPMLLLIGTLIARGQVSGPLSIIVAVAACVFVDCLWFELARIRRRKFTGGREGLRPIPLRSIRIRDLLVRHGGAALLVARFLPGPNLLAALAGRSSRVSRTRFALLDSAASTLWTSAYLAVGFFLPHKIGSLIDSCLNASPICFLFLGFAAVLFGIMRIRQRLSKRSESRPEMARGII